MGKFLQITEKIITLGQANFFRRLDAVEDGIVRVAAGDPALPIESGVKKIEIPERFEIDGETYYCKDYYSYLVTGNSMYPEGIRNDDYLLMRKNKENNYDVGDFLILEVDEEYYKACNPKKILYPFKLRKALMHIGIGMTDKEIIEKLKDTDHFQINLKENQAYLSRKYKESYIFYPNRELMLSITYHDGRLCYSFHPTDLIVGKVDILGRMEGGKMKFQRLTHTIP